ncbi:MAG: tyrosine-type recombinase/integrase [Bacilli bacterium]
MEELKSKKMLTKQRIKLKTKNSERVLDIPDYLFEVILEERKKYEKNKRRRINDKNNPFLDQGYVCCSTYGKPRSKGFHNRYYNKIFEENDLPRIRFHDLRHTYATLLLTNNHGVKAVSELLGHGSTIITTKVYFDKSKVIIDCSEKMNDYVNRVIPKEEKKSNEILLNNLDTNLIASKYL